MSHAATNWAIQQRGLKPAAKIVLWHLADCHNGHTGQCNPRQAILADRCEMSRSTINVHLADLVRRGLIRRVEPDGKIDPAKADQQWITQTDPSQQRGAHAKTQGANTRGATRKAVPKAAIRSVDETLRDVGEPPAPNGEVSFLRARMANEVLKAQTAKVRLQKMKEELVDRAKATAKVFALARRERDAWQNWPPRVAGMPPRR